MTTYKHKTKAMIRLPLVLAIAGAASMPAQAFQFNYAGVDGNIDTTMRVGTSIRVSDPDKDFISQGNLGPEFVGTTTGASSGNTDDGNLNFERGRPFSTVFVARSRMSLNYRPDNPTFSRVGARVEGRANYDYEQRDERRSKDPVGQRRELNESARDDAAEVELRDAYVFTDMWLGDIPASASYGRQVINWGESTFILGGLNAPMPIDAPAFREPGAEVEDAFLPVEQLHLSAGITPSIDIEGFFHTKWEPTKIDQCGTFFSFADVAADDCGPVLLSGSAPDSQIIEEGIFAPREGDVEPDDTGQFGISGSYFASALETEFALYYMNYHSRFPFLSARFNNPEDGNTIDNVDFDGDEDSSMLPAYFMEFPEDIEVFGVSMNTTLPTGTSMGAEYSFRPDMPIQRNTTDLLQAAAQLRGPNGEIVSLTEKREREQNPDANLANQSIDGFEEFDVSQLQATFIHFFERAMGASRVIFIGEVGANYVHSLPDTDEARFGRNATFGAGPIPVEGEEFTGDFCQEGPDGELGANINPSYCVDDGFTTDFSWGYRAMVLWDFSNFYRGWNLMPGVFFSHDVEGYSPDPAGNFQEGAKEVSLTLSAEYQNTWVVDLGYSNFFGGGKFNELSDRDFVSASLSYSF